MSYDKKCPRFVDPVRGWAKSFQMLFNFRKLKCQESYPMWQSMHPFERMFGTMARRTD